MDTNSQPDSAVPPQKEVSNGEATVERAVWRTCVRHASDLLQVAVAAHAKGKHNIAFHLAVVAIEEIGKIHVFAMSRIKDAHGEEGRAFYDRYGNDHVAKLFWGLWGYRLSGYANLGAEFSKWRNFATDVHDQRLDALYVNVNGSVVHEPRDAVTVDLVESLLAAAHALLTVHEKSEPIDLPDDRRELIVWLRQASQSEELRRSLFSAESMDMLRRASSVADWITWLRQKHEDEQRQVREIVERERSRSVPNEGVEKRWSTTFDLLSMTHAVRSKELAEWNAHSRLIQLHVHPKVKSALRLEIALFDNVRLDKIDAAFFSLATRFTTAVNISTGGLFWPYLPEQTFPVMTKARDLKEKLMIDLRVPLYETFRVERAEGGKRPSLTADDLARAGLLFSFLPMEASTFVDSYRAGLASLAKSDPMLRLERQAFDELRRALFSAIEHYELPGEGSPESRFAKWATETFGADGAADLVATTAKPLDGEITFVDAANMKLCVDLYVQGEVIRRFLNKQSR